MLKKIFGMDFIFRLGLFFFVFAICFLTFFSTCFATSSASDFAKVSVIAVEGEIRPGLYKSLSRMVAEAKTNDAEKIIFEINTFGGRLDTAYKIVELFLSIEKDTIALVKEKAISAGALIALACDDLYMMKGTTIGDCAPIAMTGDGVKMMGEKFQSPLRAKFRSLAERHGYPIKLSEAMVSVDWEILEVVWQNGRKEMMTRVEYNDLNKTSRKKIIRKKTIVSKGELLTMSDTEAIKLGFSSGTVANVASIFKGKKTIEKIELKKEEVIFLFFSKYLGLLILVGFVCVYLEAKSPGFGFYGTLALLSFFLFFLMNYLVELANYYELFLFCLGIGLLCVELFVVPGFGFFGVTGIIFLLSAMVLMMQAFTFPTEIWEADILKENVVTVLASFLLSLLVFAILFYVSFKWLGKKREGKKSKLVMFGNQEKMLEKDFFPNHDGVDLPKKGDIGIAKTPLRPSGKMLLKGNIWDVVSKSELISAEEEVMVLEVLGNKIVVKIRRKNN